ncbi:MAG: FISUMP domain-containing protein [Bacteroidota bacterium]|nr:FISUMP domain-containing protein [Bacteroidota bacterium]
MKKYFLVISLFISGFIYCQNVPKGISYQAIVRDLQGNILPNRNVAIKVSLLLENSISGAIVYSETHKVTSNQFGLINLMIGKGIPLSGDFEKIDWSKGIFFSKIEIDINGGTDYELVGVSQMLSVPYALYAEKAGRTISDSIPLSPLKNIIQEYSQSEIDTMKPKNLILIFNKSTCKLNYYINSIWFELNNNAINKINANAGPDQIIPNKTKAILNAVLPLNFSGKWIVISGDGGSFSNDSLPNAVFTGKEKTDYKLQWTIKNKCYSTSAILSVSFTDACYNMVKLKDTRDNREYKIVSIGKQCWMQENLNVGIRIDSAAPSTNNKKIEKYCYRDFESNCNIYGGLYNWYEMMSYIDPNDNHTSNIQGICPSGWHVPDIPEWDTLVTFMGGSGVAGWRLKEAGNSHWTGTDKGADNKSGFTALPAGIRKADTKYYNLGINTYFWSASKVDNDNFYAVKLSGMYEGESYPRQNYHKYYGLSVRCLKN